NKSRPDNQNKEAKRIPDFADKPAFPMSASLLIWDRSKWFAKLCHYASVAADPLTPRLNASLNKRQNLR
ncbi:MAG: hypothetical protein ACREF8_03725, partial [Chthoniobacterales bacterium]